MMCHFLIVPLFRWDNLVPHIKIWGTKCTANISAFNILCYYLTTLDSLSFRIAQFLSFRFYEWQCFLLAHTCCSEFGKLENFKTIYLLVRSFMPISVVYILPILAGPEINFQSSYIRSFQCISSYYRITSCSRGILNYWPNFVPSVTGTTLTRYHTRFDIVL